MRNAGIGRGPFGTEADTTFGGGDAWAGADGLTSRAHPATTKPKAAIMRGPDFTQGSSCIAYARAMWAKLRQRDGNPLLASATDVSRSLLLEEVFDRTARVGGFVFRQPEDRSHRRADVRKKDVA